MESTVIPLRRNASRTATAQTYDLPMPVGGWNTLRSIGVVPGKHTLDALILDNYIPTASDLSLRRGFSEHLNVPGAGAFETLAPYNSTTPKLFGANTSSIYELTSDPETVVVTGQTSARWQHTNIGTPGGRFLYLFNGVDKPLLYNGTTWTPIDAVSSPAITGVTTTELVGCHLHKSRIWLVQVGTLVAWYLPINSIGGAATGFDLRSIAKHGGFLQAITSYSFDSGSGPDDLLVFVTSKGELIVYAGSDPASNFALVGVYKVGSTLGRRCAANYGGDTYILTRGGIAPLSRVMHTKSRNVYISRNIEPTFVKASFLHGSEFGWEMFVFEDQSLAWVNVPQGNGVFHQYVVNLAVPEFPWCRFTSIPSSCWALFNDNPYFGSTDKIYLFWSTGRDGANDIFGEVKPHFNRFGNANNHTYNYTQIFLSSSASNSKFALALNVDYEDAQPFDFRTIGDIGSGSSLWDTDKWDIAKWSGGPEKQKIGFSPNKFGHVVAPYIRTSSNVEELRLISFRYLVSPGRAYL